MQSSLKPLAVGASVAAIAASLLAGPAAAAPALPTLVLSMRDGNTLIVPDTRTLGCDDPDHVTGSHPRRERACNELELVGGDFERLQHTQTACPMIYDPVTATARGRWHGKKIDFEAVFSNRCTASAESADIFRW